MTDDYPTDEALAEITAWPPTDPRGWFARCRACWWAADWGWYEADKGVYGISTGGWSGNESIINAMQANTLLWTMTWRSSRRGGHYEFVVRDQAAPGGEGVR